MYVHNTYDFFFAESNEDLKFVSAEFENRFLVMAAYFKSNWEYLPKIVKQFYFCKTFCIYDLE